MTQRQSEEQTEYNSDIQGGFNERIEPFTRVVEPAHALGDGYLLVVETPVCAASLNISGQFFLARCGIENDGQRDQIWNFYAPCTLYAVNRRPVIAPNQTAPHSIHWTVLLPPPHDWRHQWLLERRYGDRILLFGPMGNPWEIPAPGPHTRLLTVADSSRVFVFQDAIERLLDSGGRITILLVAPRDARQKAGDLSKAFPLQVEVQEIDQIVDSPTVRDLVRWADVLLADLEPDALYRLAQTIRATRLAGVSRNRRAADAESFAFALTRADYLCGYGACLACTVTTAAAGVTRACVHGPIFPLTTLVSA